MDRLEDLTVEDVLQLCEGMPRDMPFVEVLSHRRPSGSPGRRESSASSPGSPGSPQGSGPGFVTKMPHFKVTDGGLTVTKTGKDGEWNTLRIKPGFSVGSKAYYEFRINKLKKAVNPAVVLGLTLDNMPKDNFAGFNAFSWGYGTKYGHVYHKAADIPFAEQAKPGDVIGIMQNGPGMFVYKNGKKLGRAADLHGTGMMYGCVSLLHEGDSVTYNPNAEVPG
eukprot:Sspe_Gene.2641::Locus_883_Transcript_1_1_Confidence_1.000_Length_966::g.2641::m.2641